MFSRLYYPYKCLVLAVGSTLKNWKVSIPALAATSAGMRETAQKKKKKKVEGKKHVAVGGRRVGRVGEEVFG